MAKITERASAQIIQFPRGLHAPHGTPTAPVKTEAHPAVRPPCDAAGGSAWYHDEAMHSADPSRRH